MATFLTFCHPTFYPVFLPPPFQVFLEAESVVVAEPEVFALVSVAVELSPEVVVLVVEPEVFALVLAAEPEVFALVLAAEPEVFALVLAAEPSPEVVVLVVEPEVSEPGVAFVAVVSVADVAEPRASVDIAVAFAVLVPVSVVVVEVDSSGRPKFLVFPNVGFFASYSSFVEPVGEVFVDNPTDVRTNYGLCSILSNLGLHQNKNLEWCCNNPSPGYNNLSDTIFLPINATKSHSRKIGLYRSQEQHRHMSQVSLLTLVVRQIRWVVVEEN